MTAHLGLQLPQKPDFAPSTSDTKARNSAHRDARGKFDDALKETQQSNEPHQPKSRDASAARTDTDGGSSDTSSRSESVEGGKAQDGGDTENGRASSGADSKLGTEASNGVRSTVSLVQQISDAAGHADGPSDTLARQYSELSDGARADALRSETSDRSGSASLSVGLFENSKRTPEIVPGPNKASADGLAAAQRAPIFAAQAVRAGALDKGGQERGPGDASGAKELANLLPNARHGERLSQDALEGTGKPVERSLSSSLSGVHSAFSRAMPTDNNGNAQPLTDAVGKVAILSQETHLPTVNGSLVTQQVAQRIDNSLKELSSSDTHMTATFNPTEAQDTKSVVRKLTFQLNPRELGMVTVQMSLRQNMLQLDLQAADYAVARALGQGRDALSSMLQGSGYVVDDILVRPAEVARSSDGTMLQDRSDSDENFADRGAEKERNQEGGSRSFDRDERRAPSGSSHSLQDRAEVANEDVSHRDIYL